MAAAPARLPENAGTAFAGDALRGAFVVPDSRAARMLMDRNLHGKPNSDVLRPWAGVPDVLRVPARQWVVDFPPEMEEREAALYRLPFAHVWRTVRPVWAGRRRAWWIHGAPQPARRIAVAKRARFIVTPAAGRHRVFAWLPPETLPDHRLVVFARDDDWFFGVLHSRFHQIWASRMGTPLGDRPRYTPTTCFETFPFPWPPATPLGKLTRAQDEQRTAIAQTAGAIDAARNEWVGDRADPRRTLTALDHARPAWLQQAHAELDESVAAAYGWPADLPDDEVVARLLALNRERAGSRTTA